MPNWEQIREEWETSDITFKELAEKHGVKDSTVRSRKNREKWQRNATSKNATQRKSVATKKNSNVASKNKKSTSNGQKNRSGNPNPKNQFTKRNQAARKHGLFAKYFNDTQREIMEDFEDVSIADQLWMQIQIKFSAIIQMQKVMWVENSYSTLNDVSMESGGAEGSTEAYKVVYAFEQYESYIKAQSRAMAEYRNLVKQFLELAHDEDERRLKLEYMQTNIDKVKAETDKITKENETDDPPVINIIPLERRNNE